MKHLIGQPIAVIAARYQYRGILVEVEGRFITLSQVKVVETSGKSSNNKPEVEDTIPSDVMISLDAIEIIYQPAWVWDGFGQAKA